MADNHGSRKVTFGTFDSNAPVDQTTRNLPNWFQSGVAVFITFRTADSMPRQLFSAGRTNKIDG